MMVSDVRTKVFNNKHGFKITEPPPPTLDWCPRRAPMHF